MILAKKTVSRDKNITRQTHIFFLTAMLQSKSTFAISMLYIPNYFLTYVYIPLQVAYTLQAILGQNYDKVNEHLIIIAAATVGQLVTHSIAAWAHDHNGVIGCEYVQQQVFSNFLEKDYEFYSNQYIGSLGEQAALLREMSTSYSELLLAKLTKHLTIVFGGIAILLLKAPLLALITIVCMISILGYTIATSRYRLRFRRKVSEASSELAGVIADALGHGVTVKSFASEEFEMKRLNVTLHKWKDAQLRAWNSFIPANAGRVVITGAALIVLLATTSYLFKEGSISVAIVILVQLYMVRLIATTLEISEFIKVYEQIMGNSYRAIKTMQITKSITDAKSPVTFKPSTYSIELDDVTFAYGNHAKPALKNVNLKIKHGKRIGLVGYSGSGKTTLSKLLVRFIDPTSGKIVIDGIPITSVRQHDLRTAISYVPQEPLLFHRSIYENIAYGRPKASKAEIEEAARLAYVDEFVHDLPNGYDTLVGERGIKLSGGQRQRVAIARAILKDAPILVLDEATSALDSKSEQLIQSALWNLMKGRTALVIAHRLSTIQRMDEIVVLNHGSIREQGTHQQLLDNNDIYAKLWQHQSGGYIDFEAEDA